jgi:hypothetical protein
MVNNVTQYADVPASVSRTPVYRPQKEADRRQRRDD